MSPYLEKPLRTEAEAAYESVIARSLDLSDKQLAGLVLHIRDEQDRRSALAGRAAGKLVSLGEEYARRASS